MTGPYIGPHSADFLRGACLYLYGGVFMDVGIILINSIDKICWNHLASDSSPYNVAVPLMYTQYIANHFVASRAKDPFIKRWHELFVTLWKDRKDYKGLSDNPLFSFGASHTYDESRASNFHWDFSVPALTVMEYITQVTCWVRLCMLEPPEGATGEDAFNCSEYWQSKILVFDVLKENWGAEELVGFSNMGQKVIDRLRVPLSADPSSQEYNDAYSLVWKLLTRCSMQKVTHGKGLTNDVSLGTLLDRPENEKADFAEGTFAELLRYGCIHFEQTRPEIELMTATKSKVIMKKGVLEP